MYARRTATTLSRAAFHTSPTPLSHVGKQPIIVPPSVTIDWPQLSISPDIPITAPGAERIVTVKGPLGQQSLVILPPVIITPQSSSTPLLVTVHDSTRKPHKRAWGLTRSLLANAVKGVSEGYEIELRLVGVGYRAAIEPIPEVFRNLQAQLPKRLKPRSLGAPPQEDRPLPKERLNIKLGFSHPVLVDIPTNINVTIPAPTKIVLKGVDKQALGLFAAQIRQWRKPEPYRGKASVSVRVDRQTNHRVYSSAMKPSSSKRFERSSRLPAMQHLCPHLVRPKLIPDHLSGFPQDIFSVSRGSLHYR